MAATPSGRWGATSASSWGGVGVAGRPAPLCSWRHATPRRVGVPEGAGSGRAHTHVDMPHAHWPRRALSRDLGRAVLSRFWRRCWVSTQSYPPVASRRCSRRRDCSTISSSAARCHAPRPPIAPLFAPIAPLFAPPRAKTMRAWTAPRGGRRQRRNARASTTQAREHARRPFALGHTRAAGVLRPSRPAA